MNDKELMTAVDALIKTPAPPERIYHWLDSQLSIARHYGGLKYMGHQYFIAGNEAGQPLVRSDVLAAEAKAKSDAAKAERKAQKLTAQQAQGGLL